jgi:hypothetical protein
MCTEVLLLDLNRKIDTTIALIGVLSKMYGSSNSYEFNLILELMKEKLEHCGKLVSIQNAHTNFIVQIPEDTEDTEDTDSDEDFMKELSAL